MNAGMRAALASVPLLALAVTLGACGGDDDVDPSGASQPPAATVTSTSVPDATPPAPVAEGVRLSADVDARVEAGPVTWVVEATNVTDAPVVITFPTSQTAEAVIRDLDDAIVRRSSDGQFFAPRTQSVTLAPDETMQFEVGDDLSGLPPGSYELALELTAVGRPEAFTTGIRIIAPES